MANGAYIGVDSKARKVKDIFIGVDGKARKVKSAYIGVNGVARLFWSAEKVVNTLYLRPSADISVGHSLYPADSSFAYMLVNEEVNDGGATYIYSTHTDRTGTTSTTSNFALSPSKSIKSNGVTSGRLVFDNAYGSSVSDAYIEALLTVADETSEIYIENLDLIASTKDLELRSTELEAINRYISQNGVIPPISLSVDTQGTKSSTKNDGTVYIGQIYLELNGEFVV